MGWDDNMMNEGLNELLTVNSDRIGSDRLLFEDRLLFDEERRTLSKKESE